MRFRRILSFLNFTLLKNFLKWWFICYASLIIGRIIFHFSNVHQFNKITISDFFFGFYIDAVTNSLYLFSIFCVIFIGNLFINKKWWLKLANFAIGILLFWFLLTNLIDTAYYKYRFSRSTREIFEMIFQNMDFRNQISGIFETYWWIFILFILLIVLIIKILRQWIQIDSERIKWKQVYISIVFLGVLFLLGRGGIRPRPFGVMDLSRVSKNSDWVANTPFLLLKSVASIQMPNYNFMSDKEAERITQFHQKPVPQNILPDSTNVVLIILESFGNEFIEQKTITPFLNSVLKKSWNLNDGISNGLTSMEGVPAILSSMPTFSNVNYFSSNYGNNRLDGIPSILKKNGYQTAFFHGASNGSMNFDAYAKAAKFDRYFGRSEYGNDAHFDGRWGIYDEYFLTWTVDKMNEFKKPFFSSIFTLSSHHPYDIPKEKQDDFHFKTDIENATAYADFSLKKFFEKAKKSDWFENTLFVFVADHTSKNRKNNFPLDAFRIPIAFYHPIIDLNEIKKQPVASQVDVFPTILDFLNITTPYYSVGKSLFKNDNKWVFIFNKNHFLNIKKDKISSFQLSESNNLSKFIVQDWNGKSKNKDLTIDQSEMEAFLQQLTKDVKSNQTTFDEKKYSIHN